ncbi:transcriptional regulator [Actinocatenispora thailandica]|uniref:Glycerol operon regulatory protein n=2 Tax=Actinocatenispora TaxID=390988 RepID=A0A810KX68_9ACTN|nr:transcriptional regulator [Actinocatenispora sera]BCJ38655.1 transcriptional regulator [Actinocatenispora thailandica]
MRTDGSQAPSDLIQSVSRALRILETVGRSQRGLTVKQIARRCELGLSTTYHLVRTLTYEGYLIRCNDGTYLPGLEVADRFRELSAAVRPPTDTAVGLRRAAGATGFSHYLARFVDGKVAITGVAEGPRSPHLEDLIVGFDDAAHATAIGKALLATLDVTHRRRYLSVVGMRPYTRSTVVDRQQLEHDLAGLRRRGTFVERGQYRDNVACAATVISTGSAESPHMVLGCTMSLEEFQRNEPTVLNQLATVSRSIAAAVANNPTPPPLPL